MSTLNVSNITDGTTTVGTSYVVNGSAKAWVNFNGTGTIAIRDSLNVASLTDINVGRYEVNFTNSMADANYSTTMSSKPATDVVCDAYISFSDTYSSATTNVRTASETSGQDHPICCALVEGDLA